MTSVDVAKLKATFLEKEKLPESYWQTAQKWFIPWIEGFHSRQNKAKKPTIIGINGAQGSGKSTLAVLVRDYFETVLKQRAIVLSIDDFYLSKSRRAELAKNVHPMLQTRGVPGTHDFQLMHDCLSAFANQNSCIVPVFDKGIDDLLPQEKWLSFQPHYDLVIFEGWCVGSRPWAPITNINHVDSNPINELESSMDRDGRWRQYVNEQLSLYQQVFQMIDHLVMLKAPSFDCVYKWRKQQEDKLKIARGDPNIGMSDNEIHQFIQYYQRITENNLQMLPQHCHTVFVLNDERQIVERRLENQD